MATPFAEGLQRGLPRPACRILRSKPWAGGNLTLINYILNIPAKKESPYPNASNTTHGGATRRLDQATAHSSLPCDGSEKLPPHGRLGFISTRPPASNWDPAAVTTSPRKGSGTSTKASAGGTSKPSIFMWTTVSFVFPFGVVYPGHILISFPFLTSYL